MATMMAMISQWLNPDDYRDNEDMAVVIVLTVMMLTPSHHQLHDKFVRQCCRRFFDSENDGSQFLLDSVIPTIIVLEKQATEQKVNRTLAVR